MTRYEINLQDKPDWYATRVIPASKFGIISSRFSPHQHLFWRLHKVPAVVYGSSKSDPEHPSPESAKITESHVLLEFIADLYPDSGLLPKDPVYRAHVRFFIDAFSTKLLPQHFALFARGEPHASDTLLKAVAEIQDLLQPGAQFAVGEHFTVADAAILRFLTR